MNKINPDFLITGVIIIIINCNCLKKVLTITAEEKKKKLSIQFNPAVQ